MMQQKHDDCAQKSRKDGLLVFAGFIAFFMVFASVDAFFVMKALKTHTGVVSTKAYEEGLAYNDVLNQARAQSDVKSDFMYEDDSLSLRLFADGNRMIDNASVHVTLVRDVQDGYDFQVVMTPQGQGRYFANVDFPFNGRWSAKIEALWQDKGKTKRRQYQAIIPLLIK